MKQIKYLIAIGTVLNPNISINAKSIKQAIHRNFTASLHGAKQNKQKSNLWYQRLFETPYAHHAYPSYIEHLYKNNRFAEITKYAQRFEKRFENNTRIQFIFAMAYRRSGNPTGDSMLIDLAQKNQSNAEISINAAELLIQRKEPQNAINIITNCLNTTPRSPLTFALHFLKAQSHYLIDQIPDAKKSIVVCTCKHPGFDKGWLLYALIHEKENDLSLAINGYNKYLEFNPPNRKEIELHIIELAKRSALFKK